ncbi:MAG: C10 family peptidase [Bacteroidota bacterium]
MFWIRTFLLSVSLSFSSLLLYAAEVTPQKAQVVAARFLQISNPGARTQSPLPSLAYTKQVKASTSTSARQTARSLYYVFNVAEGGFVIVSADDAAYPILGFSDQGSFASESLPQAYVKWVATYEQQLKKLIKQQPLPTARVAQAWESLEVQSTTVGPLLTTTWDQSPYYNESCPYDAQAQEHAVTGCVATAMAQLMNYHQHPQKGIGFHSYDHSSYGTLSANFGLTEYAWDQMPDVLNSSNADVAQLNYHCGVAVEMDYGTNESSAGGAVMVRPALRKYFQYEAEIAERADYTTAEWISLLKAEIDAGRPMYYEGFGNGGGHAFICDGYQGEDFFHFNWGWGGFMDGYYYIGDLSPSDLGTGGGTGSFNSNQKIVYQVQPAESPVAITYELELYSQTEVTPNPIPFTAPFEISFSVANFGDADFNGQFAVVVFDENNFQEVIDSIAIDDLRPQSYTTVTLTTGGLPVVSPGNYQLAVLYKEKGQEWQLVESDNYPAYTDIEFLDSENDITLTTPMMLSSETITQYAPFDLSFNIENKGNSTFSGAVAAGLYSLDGQFQVTIGSINVTSLAPGGTFTQNQTISSSGLDLEPGTYQLVMWSATTQEATILASGGFDHPKRIVIQTPPPVADSYEDNDSETNAFTLADGMDVETLKVKTQGANQHTDVDYDYYQVVLPAGYDYEVAARVQDSFDSDDGLDYTTDVLFSYQLAGEWSEAFDTELESSIVVKDGGILVFLVSPYFAGQQGTYELDIQITRQEQFSIALTNSSWDTLAIGSTQAINWESNFTSPVTLALYLQDQYYTTIAEHTENDGAYQWTLPDSLVATNRYQIVVYNSSETTVRTESDYFTIVPANGATPTGSEEPTPSPESPTDPNELDSTAIITSISEDEPAPSLIMYPNPVQERLFLNFDNKMPDFVEITNVQGVVLKKIEWRREQLDIDLSELPSGLYLLRCQWNTQEAQVYQLLKQ